MGSVTLTRLVERARSRAEMPVVGFISAQELIDWINEGGQLLHEKLVGAYGETYAYSTTAKLVVAGGTISLPTDFFKLYGLDMSVSGRTRTLLPFMQQERNSLQNTLVGSYVPPRYAILGGNIKLLPAPATGTSITVNYAPEFTLLAAGGDTVSFPNGWEKYIVAYAAKQMLMKEESDVSDLDKNLARWDEDLLKLAESRDAAAPKQSIDMDAVEYEDLWGP